MSAIPASSAAPPGPGSAAGPEPTPVGHGDLIWSPPPDVLDHTELGSYLVWLARERGLRFNDRAALWQWSVHDVEAFWASVWDYFGVISHAPYDRVLSDRSMPFSRWFAGARINFAEHVFRHDDAKIAIRAYSQTRASSTMTFGDLRDQVGRAQQVLRDLGVGPGDRVAGYLPNIPEAIVAFLATVGLGATWASCACEFGARSVIDRFAQIEPKVLLVAGGYGYGGKDIDRRGEIREITAALRGLTAVLDVEYGSWQVAGAASWPALISAAGPHPPSFEPVAFDHPLVVLFSSGTTGLPKAIVHGHGGILLEHLKNHALSWDLGPEDTLLWFTTTAWMMWNALVSALLLGTTIVTIDGNPVYPDLDWQWRLAQETGATVMGASPGFVMACRKQGLEPGREHRLSLRVVASAGAPLPPEGYAWLRAQLPAVMLNVGSGGTDVCSGIVQGDPWLPVWAGQISGPALGVAARAFDEHGREVIGELGELVITEPMPSMPVGFWGDPDGRRLRDTYFDTYPGIWRHGDWIVFDANGSCHVAGRSDATLNRGGVRLGTAEFYRVVEELDAVADSLVVHLEDTGNGELILFVVPEPGHDLDGGLHREIVAALRGQLSPRHIPDTVLEVPAIPRNRTGKKLELPVKKILLGAPLEQVASADALAVPGSLDPFVRLADNRNGHR